MYTVLTFCKIAAVLALLCESDCWTVYKLTDMRFLRLVVGHGRVDRIHYLDRENKCIIENNYTLSMN